MKAVRFSRSVSLYNAGEVAGFDDAVARAYVEAGAAEWHQQAPSAPLPALEVAEPEVDPRKDLLAFSKGSDRKRGRGLGG